MEKLFQFIVEYSLAVFQHFKNIKTLSFDSFIVTLGYEIGAILILLMLCALAVLVTCIICAPIFIAKVIKARLLKHYYRGSKTLVKAHIRVPMTELRRSLYDLSTELYCSFYSVKQFYWKWRLIAELPLLPERDAFNDLLKRHKTAVHKEDYCKEVASFIKKQNYCTIVDELEKKIAPYEDYVDNKMTKIHIVLWIIWALLLIPIVIPFIL